MATSPHRAPSRLRRVLALALAISVAGCGGGAERREMYDRPVGADSGDDSREYGDAAPATPPAEPGTIAAAPMLRSGGADPAGADRAEAEQQAAEEQAKLSAAAKAEADRGAAAKAGGSTGSASKLPPERAMVVYQGHLRLRVKRLLEASEAVVRMAEKGGGHVASLGKRVIVVRIPASDFEAVMNAFATLGEVLDRRVWALDVTAQYTDLAARLEVATLARERLLELLAATKDADERLRIVKEVKRLTERIEGMRATLATLKNLVDQYTITIELVPVQEGDAPDRHRSPFAWVRALAPHRASLGGSRKKLSLDVPKDFVLFERSERLLAQGADTSTLRGGDVENRPRGDEAFWLRAVEHEMDGRDDVLVKRGAAGNVRYAIFRNKDVAPHYYLVALRSTEERVYVIEAFFPTAESYEARGESVIRALATLKVGADA